MEPADRPLTRPHPSRLDPTNPFFEEILRRHDRALQREDDTYVDPGSGLAVLTAAFLARRGGCCESGCRHCPYLS